MPKRIVGVSARLLDCAKEEFLNKGFQNASIREIAQKAETSPRAIYTRFPDKEGLFGAVVDPVIDGFMKIFTENSSAFEAEQNISGQVPSFTSDAFQYYLLLIDYAYDHPDEFKMILKCSEGTHYSDFIERLTIEDCNRIQMHHQEKATDTFGFDTMTKLVHVLTHSFYAGFFEPLLHEMSREEAHFYVEKLCEFFIYGVEGSCRKENHLPIFQP